jgi:hypothetical protein
MKALAIHPSSHIVDNIRIAAPCNADWDEMVGDERARHCGLCSKNVFNISAMAPDEIVDLIREKEGRVCVRLYRRHDGTVLTNDCPVGLAERAWRRAKRSTAAAIGLVLALFAGTFAFLSKPTCGNPDYPGTEVVMGKIAPPEPMMGAVAPDPAWQVEMGDVAQPHTPEVVMGEMAPID